MKVTSVHYERLKSGPGFNNEKVGISVEVEEGEKAKDVLDAAKAFVAVQLGEGIKPDELEHAKKIVDLSNVQLDIPF